MLDAIVERTNALKAQMGVMRKEAAAELEPLLSNFVKDNPQVKAVKWTQYTPYFNDGEACVFSVNDPTFFFEGDDIEDGDGFDTWSLGQEKYGPIIEVCNRDTMAACSKLAKQLCAIGEALEELFGDHVKVIVTADGVSVDEYDHD